MVTLPAAGGDYVIGVDIGGTFTDCAVIGGDGQIASGKSQTTPSNRSVGFFNAINAAALELGTTLDVLLRSCRLLVHGTTTGTNAIVTRSGARVGLLTTAGHGDAMFIMRGAGRTAGVPADQLMDLIASRNKPEPIVPKRFIVEVPERLDRHGNVVVELTRAVARDCVEQLLATGVEAVAISLLWSVRNDTHEQLLADLVKEADPSLFVSCSSDLVRRQGEYERTASAVLNAYIGPLMNRYIDEIETRARDLGYQGIVLFSQCAGGAIRAEEAKRSPILTLNSGPVAGVMNSVLLSEEMGESSMLTTDMGGTTYDVSLVRNSSALVRDLAIVEQYELALPMLDVESIGAGGGSIAWVDRLGRLDVGPESAGADPGPVCYGAGGTRPTVTDADVVLGIIDPETFFHGSFSLDVEAAHRAIADLGAQIGLDAYATAAGINRIIDSKMADLLRRMSEFRGLDPRKFAMLTFGGAGPVHAAASARSAGIRRVIVPLPRIAPVWSAVGSANADVVHVYLDPFQCEMPVPAAVVAARFRALEDRAHLTLTREGFGPDSIVVSKAVKMKFAMQVYDIDVPVELDLTSDADVERLIATFYVLYEERYGKNAGFREGGIEVTGLFVRGTGVTTKAPLMRPSGSGGEGPIESVRRVYWSELAAHVETPVLRTSGRWGSYERHLDGPCLIELPDTVIVIRPGQTGVIDPAGMVVINTGA